MSDTEKLPDAAAGDGLREALRDYLIAQYGEEPVRNRDAWYADADQLLALPALRDVLAAAARDTEKVRVLGDAITDLCWKATPYGGGDSIGMYLLPAGTVHRLIGAAQGAGIPAAFRALAAGPEATT